MNDNALSESTKNVLRGLVVDSDFAKTRRNVEAWSVEREQLPNWVKQEKIEKAVAKREMRAAKRRALEK